VKTETIPSPTPLEQCNLRVQAATQAARNEQARLQKIYSAAARSTFVPTPDAGVVEFAVQQQAHQNRTAEARNRLRNFSTNHFTESILSEDSSKGVLEAGLDHVKQLYADSLKPKAALTPHRKGLVARLESVLGAPVVDDAPAFPPPRPVPAGGLFGSVAKLDVPGEIKRLERAVGEFPIYQTFAEITAGLNAVAAALRAEEPRKPEPVRMDKSFIPKNG
jgi:hypothetical protein